MSVSPVRDPWRLGALCRNLAAALLLACVVAAPAQAQPRYAPDLQMRSVLHDGERRAYGLYVPSTYRPGQPAPLIIALHGRASSAKAFHAFNGLAAVAEQRGAIVVYPEPLGLFWADGGHQALQRTEPEADDLGFLAAAQAAVARDFAVDGERVFLLGYDTGGLLAQRAACRGPLKLAGAAAVSTLMWDYSAQLCGAGARATPMLIVHGRRDEKYPTAGAPSPGGQPARRLSANDTIAAWRGVNGCASQASATGRDGSVLYASCTGAPFAYVGVGRGENDWFRDRAAYRLNRHGIDAARLVDGFFFERAAFALPATGGGGGTARSWLVYAPPSYDPSKPMPVVVLLHGRPSNATSMAYMTRMNAVAEKKGFIVVYPEGVNNEWNAFYDISGQRSLAPQDDIKFLRDLMHDLSQDLNIDRRRAYVGGYSNGGFMTYRLACSMADTFAGFAAVDAGLYTVLKDKCRGGRATPILIMNGTADPSIPYTGVEIQGQDGQKTRISLSTPETVAWFINRNDCSLVGATTTFPPRGGSPGTSVIRFEPKDCRKAPVMFWRIDGGGHTWPGVGGPTPDAAFGATNMDINAGEVIWEFFSGLSLPEAPAD